MNGQQEAAASLRNVVEAMHVQTIKPVFDDWVADLKVVRTVDLERDDPYEDTLRGAVNAHRKLQIILKAVKQLEDVLKHEIGRSMQATGIPGLFLDGTSRVTPLEGNYTVVVTDADALKAAHPDLLTKPKDAEPDRTKIGKALRDKKPITGAVLSNEKTEPSYRLDSIKRKNAA